MLEFWFLSPDNIFITYQLAIGDFCVQIFYAE